MKRIMKRIVSVCLVVVILAGIAPLEGFVGLHLPSLKGLFSLTADAATEGTCGENVTWSFDEDTCVLTISGTGPMMNCSSVNKAPWYVYADSIQEVIVFDGVTSIGNYAFTYYSSLTKVTLPNSIENIGYDSFYNCSALADIIIPDNVTKIGNSAFYGCSSLTSVTIPGKLTEISSDMFYGCTGLSSITIPYGVIHIGSSAFSLCSDLTSVEIPNSVTTIGSSAFYACSMLAEIILPDSVTSIGEFAFENTAYYNDEANWNDSVLYIGNYLIAANYNTLSGDYTVKPGTKCIADSAFYACSSLTSIIIPDSVTEIGSWAFANACSLTDVNIPDNITTIKESTFYACLSLQNVEIPEQVTEIENFAFVLCNSITNITIPKNVSKIDSSAFLSCGSLTDIYVDPSNQYYFSSSDGVLFNYDQTILIAYPAGNSRTIYDIPTGVTRIEDDAFYACCNLTSVTIPDCVTTIGMSAFSACKNLLNVVMPDGLVELSQAIFSDCDSLKSVTLPDSLMYICGSAFSGCSGLNSIIIPDNVITIDYCAFSGCENLTNITLSEGLKEIGDSAFSGCKSLVNITIPDSVTTISSHAFSDCTGLATVQLSESLVTIGNYAFSDCNALTTIIMPDTLTSVGAFAFYNCSSLTSVTLSENLQSLSSTFYNCTALKSVYFGDNSAISSIDETAFYNHPVFMFFYGTAGSYAATFAIKNSIFFQIHEHTFTSEHIDPTDTEPGYMLYCCSDCSRRYIVVDSDTSPDYAQPWQGGIQIVFANKITAMQSNIDFIDPSSSENYYIRLINHSSHAATITSLNNSDKLIGTLVGKTILPNSAISATIDKKQYGTEDGLLTDFGITYTLDTVYDSEGETLFTFNQPAYIGSWYTSDDSKAISDSNNGQYGFTITNGKNLDITGRFMTDRGILESAGLSGDRSTNITFTYNYWVDTTGLSAADESNYSSQPSAKTWEALGFRMFAQKWTSNRYHLQPESQTVGTLTLGGNYSAIGSMSMADLVTSYSAATDSFNYPASGRPWANSSRNYCTPYWAGVTSTKWGTLYNDSGESCYFRFCGALPTPGTSSANPFTVTFTNFLWRNPMTNGGNGYFSGTINCYIFDKTTLSNYVKNLAGIADFAPLSNRCTETAWNNYKTALQNAMSVLSDQKTTQYDVTNAYNKLVVAVNNLYVKNEIQAALEQVSSIVDRNGGEWCYTSDYRNQLVALYNELHPYSEIDQVTQTVVDAANALISDIEKLVLEEEDDKNHNHLVSDWEVIVEPTCTTTGIRTLYCRYCRIEMATEVIPVIEHPYSAWTYNGDDTHSRCCSSCNLTQSEDCTYVVTKVEPSNGQSGYTSYVCSGCAHSYIVYDPASPVENFNAIPGAYCVTLSWSKAVEATVTGYKIYRRTADSEFSLLTTISSRNTLSYVDNNLTAGTEYIYYITAMQDDVEGESCDEITAVPDIDREAPVVTAFTPANLSKLHGVTTLSGNATDNLGYVSFTIRYALQDSSEKTILTTTDEKASGKGFSCSVDTRELPDGTYHFYLTAVDRDGNESEALIRTWLIDNTPPAKVEGLTAIEIYASSATLKWNADPDGDVASYRLQVKDGDAFKDVATGIKTLGYNLTSLTPETAYTYRVAGYDEIGNLSDWSEEFTLTTVADTTPPVITAQSPKSARFASSIPFSVTTTDDVGVKVIVLQSSFDGESWTELTRFSWEQGASKKTVSYSVSLKDYPEGLIYLRGVAFDTAGLCSLDFASPYSEYYVDKTAPAVVTGVTATGCNGYVEIKWSAAQESDVSGYQVFRAASEDGTYTKIADVKTLNYIDTNTAEDVLYFYKVCAYDTAGNIGVNSEVVSAAMLADTEPPYIKQLNLSSNRTTVTIVASDNRLVNTITAEYKVGKSGTYQAISGVYCGSGSSRTLTVSLPYASFADGTTVYVRAKASDGVGLESAYSNPLVFTVDKTAPTISGLSAVLEDADVQISFLGSEDNDIALYYISYSKNGAAWQRSASVSPNAEKTYTYSKNLKNTGIGTYVFRVEAVDTTGNTNTYCTDSLVYSASPDEISDSDIISATFTAPAYMEATVAEYFDASHSTAKQGIASYHWDFGDGTTADTVKPVKSFAEEGTYTVTLTVTDEMGNMSVCKKSVTVAPREKLGTVTVTVKDDTGKAMKNMPVYFDLGSENQSISMTDSNGRVSRKMTEGKHTIGACKAPDYLPAKQDVTVVGGSETAITLITVNQTIYDAEITVTKMTLAEIIAAGIQVDDPSNNNYYTATIQFRYGEMIYTGQYIRNDNAIINITWPSIKPINPDNTTPKPTPPTVVYIPNDQGLELLAMITVPTTISYLKDFYDVRFTLINNASSEFTIVDNEITIQIPSGLTLMTGLTGFADTTTVTLSSLPGGTSQSFDWCLRGDQVGSYTISVSANGMLDEFDIPLNVTATNSEPIKVRSAAETFRLRIETPDSLFVRLKEDDEVVLKRKDLAGTVDLGDYEAISYFNVGMTNITDSPINLPKIELGDVVSQLKNKGVYIQGEAECSLTGQYIEDPNGNRVEVTGLSVLPSEYTLINYYSLKFTNASGLTDDVLLAPLTSIVISAASDPDVGIDTVVDSTMFEQHYYGKIFNSHVHTYKESTTGKTTVYSCPCGYSYRVVRDDESETIFDTQGQKILDDLGFHIEDILADITFSDGKIIGPTVSVLGKDFSLFELGTSLKLPILSNSSISVDPSTQTIKIMIGAKEKSSANIHQPEVADSYWKDSYAELKNMFQQIEGDKASTQKLYNNFRKLRKGMKGLESKGFTDQNVGLDFDCGLCGFIEFSYNKNSFTYVDGGLIANVELGASYKFRPPVVSMIYVKLGVNGGLNDKLEIAYKNEKFEFANTLTAKLGASVALGIDTIINTNTYVEGYLKGSIATSINLPAQSLEECLKLTLAASGGVKSQVVGFDVLDKDWNFGSWQLYPRTEEKAKKAVQMAYAAPEEAIDATPLPRDYTESTVAAIDGVSFVKEDLYPYASPCLVNYGSSDQRLLLWTDDDGTKSAMNRTSVYASIYQDGRWSDPFEAVSSAGFCQGIRAVSDGDTVYILYETTPQVLAEDTALEEKLAAMELYLSVFDGEIFSEPVRVTDNDRYEIGYTLGVSGDEVAIVWLENSENDFTMSDGVTSLQTVTVADGTVSAVSEVVTGGEIAAFTMSEDGTRIYFAQSDDSVLQCYADGQTEAAYTAESSITNLTRTEDKVYFLADGIVMWHDGEQTGSTAIATLGEFQVVSGGGKTAFLTRGMDENRYMIYAGEYVPDGETLFCPVFSKDSYYLRDITAVYNESGNLICAVNAAEITEDGTGKANLYVLDSTTYVDIAVGDFLMEENADGSYTASFSVANNSANEVPSITVALTDDQVEIDVHFEIREPIAPGEVKSFAYTVDSLNRPAGKQITLTVYPPEEDVYEDDNTDTYTFEQIELSLDAITTSLVDGVPTITGTVRNDGYVAATNLDVLLQDERTGETIASMHLDSLGVGDSESYTFTLPESYCSSGDNAFHLAVSVNAAEPELAYENNSFELIYTDFEAIADDIICVHHVYELVSEIPATCVAQGEKLLRCRYCAAETTESIAVDPGNHGSEELLHAAAADCEHAGYAGDLCCSLCGEILKKGAEIPASGHRWNDGTVTQEATCTQTGILTYTCLTCGGTREKTIPVIGHDFVLTDIAESTCTEEGFRQYECSRCHTVYEETLPLAEHEDDGNGYCVNCGVDLSDPDNPANKCSHICHSKSRFVQVIYRILRFIWKVFGINKTCECGIDHY